ncbi:MAG: hypothetical protein WBQ34_13210 [Candidatus Acidiferrales bacterium]
MKLPATASTGGPPDPSGFDEEASDPEYENAYAPFSEAFEKTTAAVAVPVLPPFTAVIVTEPPDGGVDGAVYTPPAVIVPTVGFPPAIPFTCQVGVTGSPLTVAVNVAVAPAATERAAGLTVTPCNATIVMVAVPCSLVAAASVAVIVTVAGLGTVVGGVYNPVLASIVPLLAPPVTLHVNVALGWLARNALNCTVALASAGTLAAPGYTVTTPLAGGVELPPPPPVLPPPQPVTANAAANATAAKAAILLLVRIVELQRSYWPTRAKSFR